MNTFRVSKNSTFFKIIMLFVILSLTMALFNMIAYATACPNHSSAITVTASAERQVIVNYDNAGNYLNTTTIGGGPSYYYSSSSSWCSYEQKYVYYAGTIPRTGSEFISSEYFRTDTGFRRVSKYRDNYSGLVSKCTY